jgi:hypothetical protein
MEAKDRGHRDWMWTTGPAFDDGLAATRHLVAALMSGADRNRPNR